ARGLRVTRLTMAQALVRFLGSQYVERDGVEQQFFVGCWGIFGHGNVAGIGEALFESPDLLPYHMARNEQSMVHSAVGYARHKDRLQTFACTSSIGPGATNMLTGAALATVNRLPVLLLPGDVFASRVSDPAALSRARAAIRSAKRPLVVAGGGVIYACASDALRRFADETGIPVAETQAGKGSLPFDHPASLGAVGATGTSAANRVARDAD